MRLIDADALLEIAERHTPVFDENTQALKTWFTALLKSDILTPTIEPKRGKWIYHQEATWKYECPECHCFYPGGWNYCANCGAQMERSETDAVD